MRSSTCAGPKYWLLGNTSQMILFQGVHLLVVSQEAEHSSERMPTSLHSLHKVGTVIEYDASVMPHDGTSAHNSKLCSLQFFFSTLQTLTAPCIVDTIDMLYKATVATSPMMFNLHALSQHTQLL
jgi:hypothetical protein